MDQASLLLSLLRAANIPCRYLSGVVTVSAAEMMNWTGAKTPEAAINMLAANGIPFQWRTRHDGTITQFRFFHTWVSAYLGRGWTSLAPAFKQYEYHDGIDIKQAMGFDLNAFYNDATAGATIDPSYVVNLNEANITGDLQTYADNLMSWVNANMPGATVGDVMGYRKIVPIGAFRSLGQTFPFKKATEQYELSELPTSWRYLANFQMYGFSYDISLPELYGKRLSLAYVPATPEDQAIIDQYGGLFSVPAYLVNMKPQLKLEGQVVGEGQGVMLGTYQGCWSSFLRPLGSAWDTNEKMVTTGADYSISLDHQRISYALLQQRIANFQNLVDNLPGGTVTQEVVEEALHLTGMIYFTETDGMNNVAAVSSQISWTREPSQNFIARDLLVLYGWYVPYQVQRGPLNMDAKRDLLNPVSNIGKTEDERTWMQTSGATSSAAEHAVFEQLFQVESVSTEKILTLANRSGIPIYTLDRNNIEQIRPLLSLPEAMQYIDDEVINQGLTVIVPQRNIQLNQWQGAGWVVMDPQTGGATYYILGSLLWGCNTIKAGGSWTNPFNDLLLLAWKGYKWLETWGGLFAGLVGFPLSCGLGVTFAALDAIGTATTCTQIMTYAGLTFGAATGTVILAVAGMALFMYIYSQSYSYNRRRYTFEEEPMIT